MSQRAFILLLDLDDGTDPTTVVDELTEDLHDFDVISIHPWSSPTATTPSAFGTSVPALAPQDQNQT